MVFVGEVILTLLIVLFVRLITDTPRPKPVPNVDWVGSALSALGLGLLVFGILRASEWGWIANANSPITPFGLSLAPFVVGAGLIVLGLFMRWLERRVRLGLDPLFRPDILNIRPLNAGLKMFLAQNLILMGVFFSIPLYLQIVQGLDALDTGIRMLPVSVTMFIMSFVGARMSVKWTPRQIVRAALWVLLLAVLMLLGTIEVVLEGSRFAASMALLGVGMGLLASQLGNVVQSSVGPRDRSEAGGLQYTAQQLGSAMGTALIGAIVISALATAFVNQVEDDPRISDELSQEIGIELNGSITFANSDDLAAALSETSLDGDEADAIVDAYMTGQLLALRIGLVVVAAIVIGAMFVARRIPDMSFEQIAEAEADDEPAEIS